MNQKNLKLLIDLQNKQKSIITKMQSENMDDIHSILRVKDLASVGIELEIQINLLKKIILED
jgi:hypothetical protein